MNAPTSFQVKQQNEDLIKRLQGTGMFLNKQTVIQAGLIALMEALTKQLGAASLEGTLPTAPPDAGPPVVTSEI